MIEAARTALHAGKYITIVAATEVHARQLRAQYPALGDRILAVHNVALNWETLRLPSQGADAEVFVDHFAIEHRFAVMLHELYRFDANGSSEGFARYVERLEKGGGT